MLEGSYFSRLYYCHVDSTKTQKNYPIKVFFDKHSQNVHVIFR